MSARIAGLLALATVLAAALRVGILLSESLGVLDSDEAVVGLMARHILDGEPTAFFWGQSYGGTLEPLLVALAFALAGSGVLALKLVPILLFALAGLLVWLIGRRTIGDRGAVIAVTLFGLGPAYVVWWSTKERGFYGVTLVLSLLVVLLVLRLHDRVDRRELAALGLAFGVGWWTNAMIGFIAVPAVCWLVWRRPRVLRQAWIAFVGAAIGASLWIREAVVNDFAPLHQGPEPGNDTYLDHLHTFFAADLPMALGLRIPFSLQWPAGEVVARIIELVAVVAVVWAVSRRRGRPWEILVVTALAYPFLFAFAPVAAYNLEPRYLFLLSPIIALLAGLAVARHTFLAAVVCAVALALSVSGLRSLADRDLVAAASGGVAVPADATPAIDALEGRRVRYALASYWLAYRLTFESDENVIVASTGQVRYPPYQRAVLGSSKPARIYLAGSRDEAAARRDLESKGYSRVERGRWILFLP
jgi:4-amino-4-deoxy-L-arabinose transferase-like glycosyltransferase